MKTKKIFIVDDEPIWVGILRRTLEKIGYTNIHAFNCGKDCLDNIKLNPSIVFLDYQLGKDNGIDILKKVKHASSKTGVIFCTGLEDISVAVDAITHGSFDFLLKKNATRKEITAVMTNVVQALQAE